MKIVAWVCGISAVGKETFIRSVTKNQRWLDQLSWQNKQIAYSKISLNAIASSNDSDVEKQRNLIANEAAKLIQNVDVVLIKWQFIDSDAGRIKQTQQMIPDAKHVILHISAPAEIVAERLKTKSWWSDHGKELETIRTEQQMLTDYLTKHSKFNIYKIDNY